MTLLASVVPINCNGGNERQSIHNSRLLTTWFTPVFSQKCWWTVKGRGHPLKFINKPESSCSVSCKQKQMLSCWTALFFVCVWPISKGLYYNLSFGSLACCRLKEIPKGQMEILYLVVITIVEPQGDHIFFFLHLQNVLDGFLYLWSYSFNISQYWLRGIKETAIFGVQNEERIVWNSIWLVKHILEGDICVYIACKEFHEMLFLIFSSYQILWDLLLWAHQITATENFLLSLNICSIMFVSIILPLFTVSYNLFKYFNIHVSSAWWDYKVSASQICVLNILVISVILFIKGALLLIAHCRRQ